MESLEEKQRISELLDLYNGLLTERQRTFLELHYNEDLSYGEIAEAEKISRQAVHDTILHGKKSLFRFENHLKLLEHRKSAPPSLDLTAIRETVHELIRMVRDDILYDTGPIKRKLKRLRRMVEEGDPHDV